MLIDYDKFEIVSLGDYQIDHISNKKLLETLEDFFHLTKTTNLNYYLSGSICCSLLTNKIYRSWKDLDIIIDEDQIHSWLEILPRESWSYYEFNNKLVKVHNKKNNNYLELITQNPETSVFDKKYKKITTYNGIKVNDLKTILFWKKVYRGTPKETDFYDEILINEFINKV